MTHTPRDHQKTDDTALAVPVISANLIDSGTFPAMPGADISDRTTTRTQRIGKTHVLVLSQDARIAEVLKQLEEGQGGIGTYKITTASDAAQALLLLKDPGWQAFLFDEHSYRILDVLNEPDRLRIQSCSVVVNELIPPSTTPITAAECIPRGRITKYALDNAFFRIVRHLQVKVGRVDEHETIHDVLWRLARLNLVNHHDVNGALRPLVEAAVQALHIGRASVWQFTENPKRIRCLAMYDGITNQHSSGLEVPANLCPVYCASLANHRIMPVANALEDVRSRELGDIYLRGEGIGALLDAPIYLDGAVVGIFCCAHVGGPRTWTENEQHIAASFGDYSQLVLLTHQRHAAEEVMTAQRTRLAQALKMETIGLLAGRITNDFTDILTSISSRAQSLIARENKNNPDLTHDFHQIVALCQRGVSRVGQLAAFARPAMATLSPVNLNDVAREVSALIQCMGRPGIRIIQNARAKPDTVMGDVIEIQRAIFNAATNSIDAMQDSGTVELATTNTMKEVELVIRDTAKTHAHISGVGIGLLEACCKQHGGKIAIDSKKGDGNTIRLTFPIAGGLPENNAWPTAVAKAVHIMIIDDDRSRWQLALESLSFFGYKVDFRSPAEAIKAIGITRGCKNIAIMSLDVASMNPVECYRAIKLIDLRVRSVIIGDTADNRAPAFADGAVMLPANFSMSALVKTVESMIDPTT